MVSQSGIYEQDPGLAGGQAGRLMRAVLAREEGKEGR